MSIIAGTKFGRYEIRSKLGEGGMGEVYLAKDTKLDRRVALKILPADVATDQDRMRRFVQEAKAASALNHPNIITIHEIDQADSGPFIATEFIDGETLRQRMKRDRMAVTESLGVAVQVASALAAAHQVGIVHRDIKPENVMIRRDGIVKVLDFGLAKLTADDLTELDTQAPTKFKTDPGTVVGTASYMSPEQALGKAADARTDIFSLGIVLYEMVAGCVPFAGSTTSEVLASILSEREPQPLARYSRDVPSELERIVSKSLRKDREQRYQTVKDLLLDLQSLKQQREFEAKLEYSRPPETNVGAAVVTEPVAVEPITQPIESTTTSIERLTPKLRRRGVLLAGAVVLVLLAIALVYSLLYRNAPTTARPEIKSLAVLPLANLSGDPSQDYFADGMTEELITSLAKIGNIRVISRTSVMHYKTAPPPLRDIARELNVDAVVEGSVLRSGDRVRITVQLIHGATDTHLWAESYDRDLRDVLALQSDVGRAIANEIRIKLTPQDLGRPANARLVNPQAFDAYLKGLDYFNQSRSKNPPEGGALRKTSADFFEQAIKIQPDYALAYAELATVRHWMGLYPQSKEAAMKALQIDETVAEAHAALAYVLENQDWDFAGAEREVKRAIELNPNDSEAHWVYALHLSEVGRHDEAIREINLAEQLDPLSTVLKVNVGAVYLYARQYDRGIEQYRRVLDKEPNVHGSHSGLGRIYVFKGMYDQGIAELRRGIELSGADPSRSAIVAWAYAVSGKKSEAIKILDESLKRLASGENVTKVNIALAYAALGDRDQAFAWLERVYPEHSDQLLTLKVDPAFDSLRSDPRFMDLVRRIGFPQ